jgi:hypothetical protein
MNGGKGNTPGWPAYRPYSPTKYGMSPSEIRRGFLAAMQFDWSPSYTWWQLRNADGTLQYVQLPEIAAAISDCKALLSGRTAGPLNIRGDLPLPS